MFNRKGQGIVMWNGLDWTEFIFSVLELNGIGSLLQFSRVDLLHRLHWMPACSRTPLLYSFFHLLFWTSIDNHGNDSKISSKQKRILSGAKVRSCNYTSLLLTQQTPSTFYLNVESEYRFMICNHAHPELVLLSSRSMHLVVFFQMFGKLNKKL